LYKDKKILAIITARGGSKGLPGKNIANLRGKPLIAWTIQQAMDSEFIDKVIVSTDCENIQKVSQNFGAKVEDLRPPELALDTTPSMDVLRYEIEKQDTEYDIVLLLEPTSPLRKKSDIDRGIRKLVDNWDEYDSVVSLGKVHMEHPSICKKLAGDFFKPVIENSDKVTARQQLNDVYFPYGVFYGSKTSALLKNSSFYQEKTGYILIERFQNFEVDDMYDLACIEAVLNLKSKNEEL
jgi:CMP-N-acetylneuraminic acid synthetase